MAIGISILLGLAALSYILFPLLRRASADAPTLSEPMFTNDPSPSLPTEQEQLARAALQEVEFDYQLGNIAEPDYRSLRECYLHSALVGMKSRHEDEQELDEEIEARLHKLKDGHEQTEQ